MSVHITNRLNELLDERETNLYQLHQLTGIAYHVLNRHKQNIANRIDYKTLEKICEALNCRVEDFFRVELA